MFVQDFLRRKEYELLGRIGEGTYARVYKARHHTTQKLVAVKVINVLKMDKKKIENALNEVRIICAIEHENVVGYEDAFIDEVNKDLYIVMEYLGGGDLNDRISGLLKKKAYLREETVWRYAVQILQGLKALHDKKIIHRDIKPGNVFVSGDLGTLKLGDLNVSKIMREREMTQTVIGTPYYLPPEIWKNQEYDYRCDVYSFGCVLYEVAALRVPFQGKNIRDLFEKIQFGVLPMLPKGYSVDLYRFIKKCLTKEIAKRPTVDQLLDDPLIQIRRNLFNDIWFLDGISTEIKKLKQNRKKTGKSRKRSHRSNKADSTDNRSRTDKIRLKKFGQGSIKRPGGSTINKKIDLPPQKVSVRNLQKRQRIKEQERILTFKVETQDLSKLSRILPSLKNSRSSSAKLFSLGSKQNNQQNNLSANKIQNQVTHEYHFPKEKSNERPDPKSTSNDFKKEDHKTKSTHNQPQTSTSHRNDHSHTGTSSRLEDPTSNMSSSQFHSVSSSLIAKRKARMSVHHSTKRNVIKRVISQKSSQKALAHNAEIKAREFLKVKKKRVSGSQARLNYIKQVKEKHRRMLSQRKSQVIADSISHDAETNLENKQNKNQKKCPQKDNQQIDQVNPPQEKNIEIPVGPSRGKWPQSKSKMLSKTGEMSTPQSKTSTLPLSKKCLVETKTPNPTTFEKSTLDRPGKSGNRKKTPSRTRSRKVSENSTANRDSKKIKEEKNANLEILESTPKSRNTPDTANKNLSQIRLKPITTPKTPSNKPVKLENLISISASRNLDTKPQTPNFKQTAGSNLSQHEKEEDAIEIEIMGTLEESLKSSQLNLTGPLETKSKPASKRMNQKQEELYNRRMRKSRSQSYVKEQINSLKSSQNRKHERASGQSQIEPRQTPKIEIQEDIKPPQKRKTREPARGQNAGKRFQIHRNGPTIKTKKKANKPRPHKAKLYKNHPFKNTGSSDSYRGKNSKINHPKNARRSKFSKPKPPITKKFATRPTKPQKKTYFEMSTNFEKVKTRKHLEADPDPKSRSKSESKHINQRKMGSARQVNPNFPSKHLKSNPLQQEGKDTPVANKKINKQGRKPSRVRPAKKNKKSRTQVKKSKANRAKEDLKKAYVGNSGLSISSFARSERAMPRLHKARGKRASSKKGTSVEIKKFTKFGDRLTSSQIFINQTHNSSHRFNKKHKNNAKKAKKHTPKYTDKAASRFTDDSNPSNYPQPKRRPKFSAQDELIYPTIKEVPEQEIPTDRQAIQNPNEMLDDSHHSQQQNPLAVSYFSSKQNISLKSGTNLVDGRDILKPGMKLKKLRPQKKLSENPDPNSTRKLSENGTWKKVDEKKKTIGKKISRRDIQVKKGMGNRQYSKNFKNKIKFETPKIKATQGKSKNQESKFYSQKGANKQFEVHSNSGNPNPSKLQPKRKAKKTKPSVYKRKRNKNGTVNDPTKDTSKSQLSNAFHHSKNKKIMSRPSSRAKLKGVRLFESKLARSVQNNIIKVPNRRVASRTDLSGGMSLQSGVGNSQTGTIEPKQTIDSIGLPRGQYLLSTNINKSIDEFGQTGEITPNLDVRSVHAEVPKNSLANFEKVRPNRTRLSEVGMEVETPRKKKQSPFEHDISIEIAIKKQTSKERSKEPRTPKAKIFSRLSVAGSPERRRKLRTNKNPVKVTRLGSKKPAVVAKKRARNYGDILRKKQKYKKKKRGKERALSKVANTKKTIGYGSSRVIGKKSRLG